MSRVGRSFSLDNVKDKTILDYYDKISNKSEYIKKLILADMNNKSAFTGEQKNELKKLFSQMLEDYLKNNEISVDKKTIEEFDQDAIDALGQFD